MENENFLWKYELINAGFIYDTEIIDFIKRKNLIYILKESPFYKLDTNLKRSNIVFKLTDEEKEEKSKIKSDIVYFAEKFCKMDTKESSMWGFKKLDLFDYQKEMLKEFNDDNKVISVLTSRQMGKSWIVAIYVLHYIINNMDKSVVISSQFYPENIIAKVKHLYSTLPFYLKPGIKLWNQKSVMFDNNSRVVAMKITKEPAIGFTINRLVVNDLLSNDIKKTSKWLNSVYPTISAIKDSKVIVLNSGMNEYESELYKTFFEDKDKNFKHLIYHYSLDPEKDEKWKQNMINTIGLDSFRKEYDLEKVDFIKELLDKIEKEKNEDGL